MHSSELKAGLGNGSATANLLREQARIRAERMNALRTVGAMSRASSRDAANAFAAKKRGDIAAAQKFARKAYHEKVAAEGAKYIAAYLTPAEGALGDALTYVQRAAGYVDGRSFVDERTVNMLTDHATLLIEKARNLWRAAIGTYERLQLIPEPAVASRAAAEAAAVASGSARGSEVSTWQPVMKPNVHPLLGDFFPTDVRAAAGALQGLGNDFALPQSPDEWRAALERALGTGAAAASGAAREAGTEVSKGDPVAGAAIEAAGNFLDKVSNIFAPRPPVTMPAAEAPRPFWQYAVGAAVIAGGGYVLWRAVK